MSRRARIRQNRRDRRLAKASNWSRPGKSNPKKVGHGGAGEIRRVYKRSTKIDRTHIDLEIENVEPLKVKLGEF